MPTDTSMDFISQQSYAKKLCNAHKTILSFVDKPNKLFQGRTKEVQAVTESLLKKRMRNCVLIGQAGVGKTEILKKAISLLPTNDIFISIDLAAMISGCTLVGMFEQRFTDIVNAVANANKSFDTQICFFIDEIHNLFRVGKSDVYGTMSGGEILKPYLSDGSITIIGATTKEEYDKYIKADKALLRRLPPIFISDMDDGQIVKIVQGFGKELTKDMCESIVEKSLQIPYLHNPDCALEIADRLLAKAKANNRAPTNKDLDEVIQFMKEDING